jgi:hypothetical protein
MGERSGRETTVGNIRDGVNAEYAENAEFAEKRAERRATQHGGVGDSAVIARATLSHSKGPVQGDSFIGELLGNLG